MKKAIAIFGLLFAGCITAFYFSSTQLIAYKLKSFGLEAPHIERISFLKNGLVLEGLKLDQDGFSSIGFIGAEINWLRILHSDALKVIVLKDVSLTGEMDNVGSLTIAGLPKNKTGPTSRFSSDLMPINKIQIENMKVDLNTPIGALRFEAKLDIEKTPDTQVTVTGTIWSAQKQLGFTSDAKVTLTQTGDISMSTQVNDLRLEYGDVIATRMSGWLDATLPHAAPAKIGGEFSAGLIGTKSFKLQNFSTKIDVQNNQLRLIGQTALQNQGDLNFSITGQKQKNWLIHIENFDFKGESFNLSGLKGNLDFISLSPLQTNGPQTLSLTEFNQGFRAAPVTATFAIQNAQTILTSLSADIANGKATLNNLNLSAPIPTSTLHLDRINIADLLSNANVNGFAMQGVVSGDVPFQIKNGDIIVTPKAHLKSVSGTLNYTPSPLPSFLQGDDERMTTVRRALENLDYDAIDLTLEGPLLGDLAATLQAKGRNQAAFGERPVHLNLNIEGPLAPAVKQMLNIFSGSPNMAPTPEGAP